MPMGRQVYSGESLSSRLEMVCTLSSNPTENHVLTPFHHNVLESVSYPYEPTLQHTVARDKISQMTCQVSTQKFQTRRTNFSESRSENDLANPMDFTRNSKSSQRHFLKLKRKKIFDRQIQIAFFPGKSYTVTDREIQRTSYDLGIFSPHKL